MISIIIITHHSLGSSYQKIISHFFKEIKFDYYIIDVKKNDDLEELSVKIKEILKKFPRGRSILALTDIFGATPSNVLRKLKTKRDILVVTGLNVPMLVKAFQDADTVENLTEFAAMVVESGRQGIFSFDLNREK